MSDPAWHPDPLGTHQHRWWDGTGWTEHVADDGVGSIDPLPEAQAVPAAADVDLGAVLPERDVIVARCRSTPVGADPGHPRYLLALGDERIWLVRLVPPPPTVGGWVALHEIARMTTTATAAGTQLEWALADGTVQATVLVDRAERFLEHLRQALPVDIVDKDLLDQFEDRTDSRPQPGGSDPRPA